MKTRLYLGLRSSDRTGKGREIFRSDTIPTWETHGDRFNACIGPFQTKRGASFMRDHGQGNPHCRCVADAERLAKKYPELTSLN